MLDQVVRLSKVSSVFQRKVLVFEILPMTIAIREKIADLVLSALGDAQARGDLPCAQVDDAAIERPNNPDHGDFSCSLPLKLASQMRMNPMSIAEKVAAGVQSHPAFQPVWTAKPGFINFAYRPSWLVEQVQQIVAAGQAYGSSQAKTPSQVQVEFVSVNPTGPLHVGHARGAVFGSALSNVLSAAGYDVQREYYVNDAGFQMELFYKSLHARYLQLHDNNAPLPDGGYVGEYPKEVAAIINEEYGDIYLLMSAEDAEKAIGAHALKRVVADIGADLEELRVEYDLWFRESSLFDSGRYDEAMKLIADAGFRDERDGAVWFKSSALGEDKDNVLVRSNGTHTYFASDIAYHYDKFEKRGFQRVINIWGADHQGHVNRMRAAVQALGIDPNRMELIVYQMVTFKRGSELVRASKRSGNVISISELVEEVGVDACRYFFLSRAANTQMEFDLELAKKQSADNPVYYIQYGHARIAQVLSLARDRGIDHSDAQVSLLNHTLELALIRKMVELPELVQMMARSLEPHHLPHYAQELSTVFHRFYEECRVLSSVKGDEELTKSRLKLCEAAKTVLANCLSLMSMSAPDHM
ncbi:arginine--tRNA ligase [Dehalococcoidia bacterium]|nr:arginine--tRNA ligase [Dehalococcoidia bacterium]